MPRKLVIVQAAGLGFDFLRRHHGTRWDDLDFAPLETVFPALTCTAQATFRTAAPPSTHGMVANGLYHRHLHRALFWEQASALVSGARIWDAFRAQGGRVAMLFWQQSFGEPVDIVLSPAPIHKHGGGMVDAVYSQPDGLYERLCDRLGHRFKLHRYWGPLASAAASEWIASATAEILTGSDAPDLCLTYLPALDYDLQRWGPDHPRAIKALARLLEQFAIIRSAARRSGHQMLIFGDYAIGPTHQAVHPNRLLCAHGFLRVRNVQGRLYPNLPASRAFAVVDHEIAHVYVRQSDDIPQVRQALSSLPGIETVAPPAEIDPALAHPNAGELVLVAAEGFWFAYPWWTSNRAAPDFAGHVDIHNKPGYDPCELFFGWPPWTVSQDTSRVKGSHGRIGRGRETAWAASFTLPAAPASLTHLARLVAQEMEPRT